MFRFHNLQQQHSKFVVSCSTVLVIKKYLVDFSGTETGEYGKDAHVFGKVKRLSWFISTNTLQRQIKFPISKS